MTFYADMGTESMIDAGDHIRAVGWLSAGQPFAQGDVPPEFLDRLREFVRLWWPSTEAMGWCLTLGKHCCEFCHDFYAGGNLGVPDGSTLFAAPEMIAHYVEKHQYRPPAEFIAAVLKSPLPGTEEYRAAVENVLEPYLNYYVVNNLQEGLQAVHLLDNNKKGKANFFLLETINDSAIASKSHQPAGTTPAMDASGSMPPTSARCSRRRSARRSLSSTSQ